MLSKAYYRQLLTTFPVILDELSVGLGIGWVPLTVKYLRDEENWTSHEISCIVSMHEIGKIIIPTIVGPLLDVIGRKPMFIIIAALFVSCWSIITCTDSFILLCLARFLFGCGLAVSETSFSAYVGEITFPNIRGRVLAATNLSFVIGILLSVIFGTYLPYYAVTVIPLIVCLIFLLTSYAMVETPHYYVIKGNPEAAMRTLAWLHADDNVEVELKCIENHVNEKKANKPNIGAALLDPVNLKMCSLTISISTLGISTGYYTLSCYATVMFVSSEIFTPAHFTMFLITGQIGALVLSLLLIDKVGRRPLLLIFSSFSTLLHLISATFYYMQDTLSLDIPGFPWIVFTTLTSYTIFYGFGFSAIHYALRSEMFPQQLKGIGNGITTSLQGACAFLLLYIYPHVVDYFGVYVNFILFASSSGVIFFIVLLYLPETKGKPVNEIEELFKNNDKNIRNSLDSKL